MAKPTTSGFTISGLLDRSASTRNDYPVERIPIEEIADHPAPEPRARSGGDAAGRAKLPQAPRPAPCGGCPAPLERAPPEPPPHRGGGGCEGWRR